MVTAIHIELDALCLLILGVIALQSIHNVNQQMKRILFRNVVYGVSINLTLDILWLLIEGHHFPGAILLNQILNALFLAAGVVIGCMWYLYVLETLGYQITRGLEAIVMLPGAFYVAINLLSIKTGWIFTITPDNIYVRGSKFWIQMVGAYGALFISLIHILIWLLRNKDCGSHKKVKKLLFFYIIPVVGSMASIPFSGMPGSWTCAAISIVLIYIDDQDNEILRDGLTGLNNRKTLDVTFSDYVRQISPEKLLYLFMIDLDKFKQINDTLGHPIGDEALVSAASILTRSMSGHKGIIARYGGDEFLIMTFFENDESAESFKTQLKDTFLEYNKTHELPYHLAASIGFAQYEDGLKLSELIKRADGNLYIDKKH